MEPRIQYAQTTGGVSIAFWVAVAMALAHALTARTPKTRYVVGRNARRATILTSDVVRQLVAGKDFLFADRGETNLKGFDEPVRLFEVKWRE